MRRVFGVLTISYLGLWAAIAPAQPDQPIQLGGPRAPAPAVTTPAKADMAAAYLRLDREIVAKDALSGDHAKRLNAAFDEATSAFFAGALGAALGRLDGETAALRLGNDALPQHIIAMSFQTRIDPPVWRTGLPEPRLTVAPLYEIRFDRTNYDDPRLVFAVVDAGGASVADHEVTLTDDSIWPWTAPIFRGAMPGDLRPGVYTITARWAEGRQEPFAVGRWQVVARSMDAVRDINEARLNLIEKVEPGLARAIAMTRSRNAILSDDPSPENPSQWLADQTALADAVDAELASLEQGIDPFVGKTGDWWCRLPVAGGEMPLRVFIPEKLPDGPAPLVIALHGMGGDENMFMDGYGDGAIRRLAEERGFIVASPEAGAMAYPASFDALLDAVAAWREVERERVFLIGHSMGAGFVSGLARQRAGQIAAIVMIAGSGVFPAAGVEMPRTLVIGAELDTLVRPSMLKDAAVAARERGLPVESRTVPDMGHTFVVTAALPDVVDWLMPAP